jgi:hypothetical protein
MMISKGVGGSVEDGFWRSFGKQQIVGSLLANNTHPLSIAIKQQFLNPRIALGRHLNSGFVKNK